MNSTGIAHDRLSPTKGINILDGSTLNHRSAIGHRRLLILGLEYRTAVLVISKGFTRRGFAAWEAAET